MPELSPESLRSICDDSCLEFETSLGTSTALQRRRLSLLARLNALLALVVLALSVVLIRGLP